MNACPHFACGTAQANYLRLFPFCPRAWPFLPCKARFLGFAFPSGLNIPCNISAELRASGHANRPAIAGHGDATQRLEGRWVPGSGDWRNNAYVTVKGLLPVGAEMRPSHSGTTVEPGLSQKRKSRVWAVGHSLKWQWSNSHSGS